LKTFLRRSFGSNVFSASLSYPSSYYAVGEEGRFFVVFFLRRVEFKDAVAALVSLVLSSVSLALPPSPGFSFMTRLREISGR